MTVAAPRVELRRGADRATTKLPWLHSRHCFSFGPHYDAANTHHGALLVTNEDVVAAGTGFETHPHSDMEIVTWVLSGSLVHQDSTGRRGVVYPGLAQRMSAGRGILHSEKNEARSASWPTSPTRTPDAATVAALAEVPAHFVQMWVRPDESGTEPGYEQCEIPEEQLAGGLVPVASGVGRRDAAIRIGNSGATLYAARLQAGQSVQVPEAPFVHLFVPVGAAALEEVGELSAGDAVRFTGTGGHRLTASEPTELLVWKMQSG